MFDLFLFVIQMIAKIVILLVKSPMPYKKSPAAFPENPCMFSIFHAALSGGSGRAGGKSPVT